jgi:hypothetical protein
VILAVDNARRFSRFSRLGITYELPGLIQVCNFEHEENVVGFLDATPDTKKSKASLLMSRFVRSEQGLPA